MKILLTGKNRQVGWELNRALLPLGEVVALDRNEADLSKPEELRHIVRQIGPDIIVNAAAYTSVDKAEEDREVAVLVNQIAPGVLAQEAKYLDALLVHYSTDYVFDGAKTGPYLKTDKPKPVNIYGETKLKGEQAVQLSGCDYLIFRTSWVYASRGHNFLLTILRLAKEREELNIVSDQVGAPTSAKLIAETSVHCIKQSMKAKQAGKFSSGLFHLSASGLTSWHGFAVEIISKVQINSAMKINIKNLRAISSAEYPTQAVRPLNSQLDIHKLENTFEVKMPNWKTTLQQCIEELEEN